MLRRTVADSLIMDAAKAALIKCVGQNEQVRTPRLTCILKVSRVYVGPPERLARHIFSSEYLCCV